ncbi:DUF1624 domain-containing protein [Povalibacter sp.]|uniref:DUF1624 domain-containing protein n=1 Tax=Povalibacter sp. TaxID=1962978 RepID=UPI002F42FA45
MSSTPFDLQAAAAPSHAGALTRARIRLQSIDVVRGLVMVLMTLDHVRHYFTDSHIDPLNPDETSLPLYLTRWITHLCAPTFVFLAGVSAFLMSQRLSPSQLSRFLLTRGLWLIALELTVINISWTFMASYPHGVFLQVIWAIGAAMVAMAALARLPSKAVLCVAIALIAGHNLLDGIAPGQFGVWAPLWNLLHVAGPVSFGFVAYPVIPWIGVMALGYCAGAMYRGSADTRRTLLVAGGGMALAAFFVLRLLNGYGDTTPWTEHATLEQTAFAFFNVQKYPPSLLYVLATLGIAALLLAAFEGLELRQRAARLRDVLRTFGRVPLFFYVLHIPMAHLLAAAVAWLCGFDARALLFYDLFRQPPGWGFGLPMIYAVWVLVLALGYPLCLWFCRLKERRNDWWLSYL